MIGWLTLVNTFVPKKILWLVTITLVLTVTTLSVKNVLLRNEVVRVKNNLLTYQAEVKDIELRQKEAIIELELANRNISDRIIKEATLHKRRLKIENVKWNKELEKARQGSKELSNYLDSPIHPELKRLLSEKYKGSGEGSKATSEFVDKL